MSTALWRATKRGAAVLGAAAISFSALAFVPAAMQTAGATSSVTTTRIAGPASDDNRYSTEAALSQKEFPGGASASNVIVTRGDIIPDGITASTLSHALNAPILLIGPPGSSAIPNETITEIQRVLAPGGNIYVLGDLNSVDANARAALSTLVTAGGKVVNVDGTVTNGNRYISSADHALLAFSGTTTVPLSVLATFPGAAGKTAFFANGLSLIDALCAGQLAYLGFPVFLVDGTSATLDPAVSSAVSSLAIKQAVTLGDSNSISPATSAAIQAATGGAPVINKSGNTRYGTCAALATLSLAAPWSFPGTNMIMTLGFPRANDPNPPSSLVDSIGAGTLGGRKLWPVVLASTGGLPSDTANFMALHSAPVTNLWIPGSNASTPDAEVAAAQTVLQTGFVPAHLSSIAASNGIAAITATFSAPVWSGLAPTAAGLLNDFLVSSAGHTNYAPTSVVLATSAVTASATVTINIPVANAPTALLPNVYVEYNGNTGGIVDTNGVQPTTSNAQQTAAAKTTLTGITVVGTPTGAGTTVTANFSGNVGLCTGGGGAGSGAGTAAGVSVQVTTPPATSPTAQTPSAATSVTSPASAANVIVVPGTPSTAINFTVTAIPSGSAVALLMGGPAFAGICDINGNPLTGGQNGFATAS